MYLDVPEATKMASPLHPNFPEYVGRKVAESVPTEVRSLAATKPNSPIAELVRDRDAFALSMDLVSHENGFRLPKGTEAAQIAAGLAGTYIREPVANEAGERGYIVYLPSGLVYGTTGKEFEGYLHQAAYITSPPDASPFVPESELDIYGGQPNFLLDEIQVARRETAVQLLGLAATQHLM